jgi:hypothetical protein
MCSYRRAKHGRGDGIVGNRRIAKLACEAL